MVGPDGYTAGAMSQLFRLFWLRETGCDAGTLLRSCELEPELQSPLVHRQILELADGASQEEGVSGEVSAEILLLLPYLSQREWRRRGELLAGCTWKRRGNIIFPELPPGMALRSIAANLALTDPVWIGQPSNPDVQYVAAWRDVSETLQRGFRQWISEEYFRDLDSFTDREAAYPMIVYQAARVCHGRSRGVFTYDLRDYPECRLTLALATKMTGRSLQSILAGMEQRLLTAGMPELARRYAPLWSADVVAAVRRKPQAFIALLRAESAFIDALVELGLNRTTEGVHHFSKVANQALRKVSGMDARHLGVRALEKTTRVLAEHAGVRITAPELVLP